MAENRADRCTLIGSMVAGREKITIDLTLTELGTLIQALESVKSSCEREPECGEFTSFHMDLLEHMNNVYDDNKTQTEVTR